MTASTSSRAMPTAGGAARDDRLAWARRPWVATLVLLVLYALASFAMDPAGSLGTDTGGKVATLEVMGDRGDLDPDVGYWAAEHDPDAELHGLYHTQRIGDRFVNVTTLPMVVAARPLHELGGYRLALLLPMLGSAGAALGARALARRAVAGTAREGTRWWGDGWAAFWIVGAASPLTVYALDLWEHSIGVALMVAAVVVLVDVAAEDRPPWWAAFGGAALGASFSLRTESVAYAVAIVGVAAAALAWGRRRPGAALVAGGAAVAGFAAMVAANLVLEVALLGESMRAGRASSAAGAGGGDLGERGAEAIVTTAAFLADGADERLPVYLAFAALLCGAVWLAARRREPAARVAAAAVAGLYLFTFARGPGFVPGLLAAAPVAAVGVVLAWRHPRARLAATMAVAALPLVWAFQYSGGAVPQWGGRYVLTTTTVLVAVGSACARDLPSWARRGLVVLSVAVTAFGLAWLAERSHEVARAGEEVAARPEPVVVSDVEFWLRELGPHYAGSRWLTVEDQVEVDRAAELLRDEGVDRFALLSFARVGPPEVPGFVAGERTETTWLGTRFLFTTFSAESPAPSAGGGDAAGGP